MDYGYTIFKGILQGLTEFLPVSSTAHLTFTNAFFRLFGWHEQPLRPGEEEFFDILLHLGTLMAVIYYFRSDLARLILMMTGETTEETKENPKDHLAGLSIRRVPLYLVLSMTVTCVFIGIMLLGSEAVMDAMGWSNPPYLETISDFYFVHPQWVAFHLIITGCLLFFTEKASARIKANPESNEFTKGHAMFIGLFQGFSAIFHGLSRSGSTISAGLMTGLDRVTATRYSFLLSIPTFMLAMVYESVKLSKMGIILELSWPEMLAGMAFSAIVGYLCVKYFIQFVAKHSLVGFAVYCWAMGAIMWVVLNMAGPAAQAH